MEKEINEPAKESEDKINDSNILISEIVKPFLKGTNLKEIIESLNSGKTESLNFEVQKSNNNLSFWNRKFIKDFAITGIVLLTISILAFYDKINGSTLGTLLGSVIGYSLGNSNSKRS
ncbi:hypothetical protein PG911_08715 [Tenacibaculum ovolyticum]|uniref:hypothetical protein n=1 Tax=Tenacibaculum ovolyticum TaxID=104270 RepID=UPI0022F3FAAB|nr:hypothetical protein [Tenacibaculum ovolyticum]WBX78327.1 hypothetical protein PG911_08715 [Tenacibaculum ovolyticum]